jgi:hypothetical protein
VVGFAMVGFGTVTVVLTFSFSLLELPVQALKK